MEAEKFKLKELKKSEKGIFLTLSWPDTMVVQEGKWYDVPSKWLGILKDRHYKVGHSACVLIGYDEKVFRYFDFGRYQTPMYMGRVRDCATDRDLTIPFDARMDENGQLLNLNEALLFLGQNSACHGDGRMLVSIVEYAAVGKGYAYAKKMQARGTIYYGPFKIGGTNCSRFVCSTAYYSAPDRKIQTLLNAPYTLSPTPNFNVRVMNTRGIILEVRDGNVYRKKSNELVEPSEVNSLVSELA